MTNPIINSNPDKDINLETHVMVIKLLKQVEIINNFVLYRTQTLKEIKLLLEEIKEALWDNDNCSLASSFL